MSKIIKFFGKNRTIKEIIQNEKFEQFSIIKMQQVHGNEFVELNDINENNRITKSQALGKIIEIPNVDAAITNQKNILLTVKTADCLPILIYFSDSDKSVDKKIVGEKPAGDRFEVIAAIHSGRVGTEKRILTKVLEYLKLKYKIHKLLEQSSTAKLTIWFGPAICKKCYQINQEKNTHYDLYQKNLAQIREVFPNDNIKFGTKSDKIRIIKSKFCTLHNNDLFNSYRKSGKGVEMNYSLIGLTED